MIDFVSNAYAMGAGGQGGGQSNPIMGMLPLVIMFVVFYFLIIMPQQKKAKKHKQMLENLKKGDMVLLSSGIYGTITGVAERALTVEIANNVSIRVNKGYVASVVTPELVEKEG